MGDPRLSGGGACGRRRWAFADCAFDELNWTLTVAGRRVAIETKPLEILRQLLLRPGQVVSKSELLDAIWPGIAVVEASLPTAVHKLRASLGDEARDDPIIETVPRIGYRLAVPVTVGDHGIEAQPATPAGKRASNRALNGYRATAAAVGLLAIPVMILLASILDNRPAIAEAASRPTFPQVDKALRTLDVERIDAFLAAGWDPNMALDAHGTTALTRLLDMCEWDPAHDRRRMLLMARTLIDGGTDLVRRNAFGDTPYSIAKAPRFCGPDHPVTVMLKRLCYNGGSANIYGDRCLASYELRRRAIRPS